MYFSYLISMLSPDCLKLCIDTYFYKCEHYKFLTASKRLPNFVYYTKNDNGDYCYDICKQSTPLRDLIIQRDKTGSTMALWKHLEKCHHSIYRDLKPSRTQNPLTNFFSKTRKYSGRTRELIKQR